MVVVVSRSARSSATCSLRRSTTARLDKSAEIRSDALKNISECVSYTVDVRELYDTSDATSAYLLDVALAGIPVGSGDVSSDNTDANVEQYLHSLVSYMIAHSQSSHPHQLAQQLMVR